MVAYDGTEFHGWQSQPAQRTVQDVLETALGILLEEPVRVRAAGRTDAGCHARGQAVSFATASRLPAAAFAPAARRVLPREVRVVTAEDVADGFDARRSAIARRYAYRLLDAPDLLLERSAWWPGSRTNARGLDDAVRPLEGDHDCAAFASQGGTPVRTVCRVHRAAWRRWEAGLMLDLIADHFLYRMVRTIVGTALAFMDLPGPASAMAAVLASRDRARAGRTVPPCGLCLEEVFYPAPRSA